MKKAVVTGGAGFIGSTIVKTLLDQGVAVHVIDNYADGKKEDRLDSRAEYHDIDMKDTAALTKLFQGADVVFHCAALPRVQFSIEFPKESNDANVGGTLSVLLAARDAKVGRVVYSASSSAYGDAKNLPTSEEEPAAPKSPYALQKYIGELYCRLFSDVYGLSTVSLRYFNVYGPGGDPQGAYAQVLPLFIQKIKEGKLMTITGDGSQTRDMVHVRDVARANILAATSEKVGRGEVINIGSGTSVSIKELALMLGDNIEYIAPRLEPHDTLADRTKAKDLLDWEPTITAEEGVRELKSINGLS